MLIWSCPLCDPGKSRQCHCLLVMKMCPKKWLVTAWSRPGYWPTGQVCLVIHNTHYILLHSIAYCLTSIITTAVRLQDFFLSDVVKVMIISNNDPVNSLLFVSSFLYCTCITVISEDPKVGVGTVIWAKGQSVSSTILLLIWFNSLIHHKSRLLVFVCAGSGRIWHRITRWQTDKI